LPLARLSQRARARRVRAAALAAAGAPVSEIAQVVGVGEPAVLAYLAEPEVRALMVEGAEAALRPEVIRLLRESLSVVRQAVRDSGGQPRGSGGGLRPGPEAALQVLSIPSLFAFAFGRPLGQTGCVSVHGKQNPPSRERGG